VRGVKFTFEITETPMTLPEKPEPSVLDYLKSRLFPGKNPEIKIPEVVDSVPAGLTTTEISQTIESKRSGRRIIWALIVIIVALLIGQKFLESPTPSVSMALIFWACAISLILINWFAGRFETNLYTYVDEEPGVQLFQPFFLGISVCSGAVAFFLFSYNRYTQINVSLWIVSIICIMLAFFPIENIRKIPDFFKQLYWNIFHNGFNFHISPWTLIWVSALILVIFFRFYRLDQVPFEMISDHAEKLLDVNDVLGGASPIFFVRNTGREGFQLYLSVFVALVFKTGISFITLKIGTALMGVVTAIFMYFLGKEVGNRWVGLFAFILCGIGYWPNVISRIGLRFTLYPAFTAPALYFFFKGMRRKRLSDIVLAGIFIGIGLQGYTPYRMVPALIIVGVILYFIHIWKTTKQEFAITALFIAGLAALIMVLPLLRYILDRPEMFAYRTLTRVGTVEQALPGPAWQIFLNNFWLATIMPFYRNGTIWVHSIPSRPALDVVGGALYLLGLLVCTLRYIRHRDWRIPFLILAVPFLMLPSIFSLAFPDENPCLNRTAGALVPIFLIAAIGLDTFLQNIKKQTDGRYGSVVSACVGVFILVISIVQNYSLVFDEYNTIYTKKSLNTSQIGDVVHSFAVTYGDPNSAYVVGYPYWVDTRLVGMNAGLPTKDYAIWPDNFNDTLSNKRAKLFIINQSDTSSLDKLRLLYPNYYESLYRGWISDKDFIMFLVPPAINSIEEIETTAP
jgi:hypothetical protein